jgi:hypothetical protein
MDKFSMPVKRLESVLDELAQLHLTAIDAVRAGDRQGLCEASENLLALHLRFAILYRRMLADQAGPDLACAL